MDCAQHGKTEYAIDNGCPICALLLRIEDLEADRNRIARLPEMEWASVTASMTQVMAVLSRQGHLDVSRRLLGYLDAGKIYINRVLAERDLLLEAIQKTIKENAHLADGEDCTLIHLKRAMQNRL